MAKAAISQEEIQLRKRARRRLVGASFLVLVMIIVLPMILDSEPRPQAESVRVQMPAAEKAVPSPGPEDAPARPPSTPSPEKTAPSTSSAPSAESAAVPKGETHAQAETERKNAESAQTAATPPAESAPGTGKAPSGVPPAENGKKAAPQSPADSTTSADSAHAETIKPPVVIQLGAFSKPENAKQLRDQLAAHKIKSFSEVIKSGAVSRTRVRAGPFDSMAEAERARGRILKLKLKLGMDPKIVAQGQ